MSEHVYVYEQDFVTGEFRAACSCEWESRGVFHTTAEALNAWENHTDAVFMEATEREARRASRAAGGV